MSTTAQSVIKEVQTILIDIAGARWPASDLVPELNDMQRAIVAARPDAKATKTAITLAAGTEQSLPATAMALIEITNLTAGNKDAVRECRREDLDGIKPQWRNDTQSATIVHYIYDTRSPRRFVVWPPAIVSTQLDAIVANYPTDVAAPTGDGKAYTLVSGNIDVPDELKAALVELILYRAYMKDSEYAANSALAQAHLGAAVAMIGEQLRTMVEVKPASGEDGSA